MRAAATSDPLQEYGPQRWNLPATPSRPSLWGNTRSAQGGPPIDKKLYERVLRRTARPLCCETDRSAGKRHNYTNQILCFAGAPDYLKLTMRKSFPDAAANDGKDRIFRPAGYFYKRGPDGATTSHTSQQRLMAWHTARHSLEIFW